MNVQSAITDMFRLLTVYCGQCIWGEPDICGVRSAVKDLGTKGTKQRFGQMISVESRLHH